MNEGVSRRGLLALAGGALANTNPLTVIRAAAQVVGAELTDEQVSEILQRRAREPGDNQTVLVPEARRRETRAQLAARQCFF